MDNTENYFSTVRLNDDYIPLGSGKPMCLHVEWIKKAQGLQIDRYLDEERNKELYAKALIEAEGDEIEAEHIYYGLFMQYISNDEA